MPAIRSSSTARCSSSRLLPSGIVRPNKLSVIGNGVVVDPYHLVDEIAKIEKQGVVVTPETLAIAENVTLILSLHRELDAHRESAMAAGIQIGTTKRGIGPAYEDKVGRRAIRLSDLAEPDDARREDRAPARASRAAAPRPRARAGRRGLDPRRAAGDRAEDPAVHGLDLRPLETLRREGKRILFEGAQGALLDVDHGTYPFVTSSNTVASNAATGSGLGPEGHRLRARHRQGLHDARRRRSVPDRAARRRPAQLIATRGMRGRRQHRPAAPLRLVRRGAGAPDGEDLGHRRDRADQARHSRRVRARSRSARTTNSTDKRIDQAAGEPGGAIAAS